QIIEYQGGDIVLNQEENILLSPDAFEFLDECIGKHIICTRGKTLLGADDKAGVAEIMALCELFMENPQYKHGEIRIGFTPDEEVGNGAVAFDVKAFGADYAYTVDGGTVGEIEYENFNASTLTVTVEGVNIHPGSSKNKMVNSQLIAIEFNEMLPNNAIPAATEGYEGFFHLQSMEGSVEHTQLSYIIRDHDAKKFAEKENLAREIGDFLNKKYGNVVTVSIKESYRNMKEQIVPHIHLIEKAREAVIEAGGNPRIVAIRGGTDGARLSFMGLPCPNLGTGGQNFHGRHEFIAIEDMELNVEILKRLVEKF
ncbi:MAG: peptidase T, partial [Oscillospiraceae bacterium]